MDGIIFDIQRFSVDDGPGIRSVVFLKGCNMRCSWCHNPESHHAFPEILYSAQKCVHCGKCVEVCPQGAHVVCGDNVAFERDKCTHCGYCAQVCVFDALVLSGRTASAAEVMAEVDKDAMYYKNSGGGVTFSGGEPLLQADFLVKLLEECKKRGYHCAIETAGNVEWNAFLKVLPYTDLFLYDVKLLDESSHIEATGAGNKRILENLRRLSEEDRVIWVRTPVIPGVNDDKAELDAISSYALSLKTVEKYELLPYHSLGESKYGLLGRR